VLRRTRLTALAETKKPQISQMAQMNAPIRSAILKVHNDQGTRLAALAKNEEAADFADGADVRLFMLGER
jgi:hypothetical protein